MKNIANFTLSILVLFLLNSLSFGAISYIHTDHLGSVVAESNSYGTVTNRYYYKPFGLIKPYSSAPTFTGIDQPTYTGHTLDEDTSLIYMKARFYDPEIGRFYSPDLIGFTGNPHSLNRYIYANNNPFKYTDPSGKYAELPLEALSIAAGSLSFSTNIRAGNYLGASIDILGIGFDIFASAVPGVIGGAGLGIGYLRASDSLSHLSSIGDEAATLYRAVSRAELDDISVNGLRVNLELGQYESKLFATSIEDAVMFGRNNFMLDGEANYLMKVDIPGGVMNEAYFFEADWMPAVSIPADALGSLEATLINFSPVAF